MGNTEPHQHHHLYRPTHYQHRPNMWNQQGGSGGYTLDWEYASNGQVPQNAIAGGRDASGETYYVGRARHGGNFLVPGKVQPSHGCIYYPYGGEQKSNSYEVLVNRFGSEHLDWVQSSGNNIPPNAVLCGHQENNERTYIGRHWHEGALVIGKVQPSHGSLYIPFGGREVQYREYEILVSSQGAPVWNPNTYMGSGYIVNNTSGGPPINPWGGGNSNAPINPFGSGSSAPPPYNPNFDGNQRNW